MNKVASDVSTTSSQDLKHNPTTSDADSNVNRKKVRKLIAQSFAFAGMVNMMGGYNDNQITGEELNETIYGGD